jgi:hypothetical protein
MAAALRAHASRTDEVDGHRHVILHGSVTQPEAGHAHRYFL